MSNLVWLLVFVVNGQTHTMPPDISEACLLHMLSKPLSQGAYCVNLKTGAKMFPPKQ